MIATFLFEKAKQKLNKLIKKSAFMKKAFWGKNKDRFVQKKKPRKVCSNVFSNKQKTLISATQAMQNF